MTSKPAIHFHILTLFPEVFQSYFAASILGRAIEKGVIQVSLHQLRDYARNKHHSVDDKIYGGGTGMLFRPEVVVEAVEEIKKKYLIDKVILTSPRGKIFNHQKAEELSQNISVLIICGRYEGVDQRAIDLVVDEEISMGDYVITGGELAAQIMVDSISRQIEGVLESSQAIELESHVNHLLEYPQYTRPAEYRGLKVPEVLLSGHHAEIEKWRLEESERLTQKNRPDMWKIYKNKE